MKIYNIDREALVAEEIRKSLSVYNEPANIAVKLQLIKSDVGSLTYEQKLFNKLITSED
jgi:hypothetical protein